MEEIVPNDGDANMEVTSKFGDKPLLNPNPSLNPIFQKVSGRNLNLSGGNAMIMRNQLLDAYEATETHANILTTSEFKAKQDEERQENMILEKAKLEMRKAQTALIGQTQATNKSQKPTVDGQPITSTTNETLLPSEVAEDESQRENLSANQQLLYKSKYKQKIIEVQKLETKVEESPKFVSLWEKYAGESAPEGEVESEATEPSFLQYKHKLSLQSSGGLKNVSLQVKVKPKDNEASGSSATVSADSSNSTSDLSSGAGQPTKIFTGKEKSKTMMNVATMVKPRIAYVKNAYTMARPRGYRELNLGDETRIITDDKDTQVSEIDIERSVAESRGIILRDGNILWPSIAEFTLELAEIKIKTYIRNFWKMGDAWMHDIRFIQTHTTNYQQKHIFEVIFSTPTNEFPVPSSTASVFFVFEAGHYNCPDQTMKVHYVLEGTRFPYTPGTVDFQEDWLRGIIDHKTSIQKAMNF